MLRSSEAATEPPTAEAGPSCERARPGCNGGPGGGAAAPLRRAGRGPARRGSPRAPAPQVRPTRLRLFAREGARWRAMDLVDQLLRSADLQRRFQEAARTLDAVALRSVLREACAGLSPPRLCASEHSVDSPMDQAAQERLRALASVQRPEEEQEKEEE
ncbi:unnamed protein product [Prorocentrum cordatum]|uniref:Uncharacterized protein n=1 Tax=Prorocentrum cordatum TaxID=2364126 RepID=A0ABN9YKT1_9DINO|nr:unnamed protein product [Polarella glacialis]